MKKTALWPLQEAINQRLSNDPAIIAAVTGGVHDTDLPEGQNDEKPYIVLGEDTVNDFSSKTFDGEEITHTLHIWSSYDGKKEVKQIMNLVLQSITKSNLVMTGFAFGGAKPELYEVFGEDGYYHGVMRFRFKIIQGE